MTDKQRAPIEKTSLVDLNLTIAELAHSLEWMMDPSIRSNIDDRATPEKYVVAATGVLNRLKPLLEELWNDALDAAVNSAEVWTKPDEVRLRAGEMTAQEMRSVIAVSTAISASLQRLKFPPPVHR